MSPRRQTTRFNPRAPYGARLLVALWLDNKRQVSTHAPRTGRGRWAARPMAGIHLFQPTRPVRGAALEHHDKRQSRKVRFNPRAPYGARLTAAGVRHTCRRVSTHAPRTGRGDFGLNVLVPKIMFQPTRPVRGAAPPSPASRSSSEAFQPTRPVRGAAKVRRSPA